MDSTTRAGNTTAQGNLRDWWTAEDAQSLRGARRCIVEGYSGFSPVAGVHLNGKLTLGENAADNGGIHLAYMALMDSLAKHMAGKLDGFTPQQQFFLGFGQIWCENSTEQSARMQAATNPHSPGEFRANGVVAEYAGISAGVLMQSGRSRWFRPILAGSGKRLPGYFT